MAKYKQQIGYYYGKLNEITKIILMVASFVLYMYSHLFLPNVGLLHLVIIDDWMIAIGCSILITFALNSIVAKKILQIKTDPFCRENLI